MKKNLRTFLITAASIAVSYLALIFLFQAGIISNYYQGIIIAACINVILAVSLNLTTGCLGELVLGHAGFMSIGAYASALFTLNMDLPMAVEFPISLLLGGLVAGFCGMLIGIPALRLRGDYLAIITLGFGEIIRVLILNLKFTGGGRGLSGIPEYTSFNWVFFIMVATIILMFTLMFSRHGRSILAIRDNLIAAEAVGVNTTFYKIYAFTISSFFAGVAGGLYAHYITVLDPTTFGFMRSVEILIMVVLGGMGSFTGSVLAAGFLTLLPELLRSLNDYRLLIYSIALVVMMIFRPEGLLGKKELPDLFRKKAAKGGEQAHE
ncbi:MAG: branched-chain amino acid ABC transporter permease [Peptococcaceae bacterium]|jgi:branched-chain amino acid transport system permease protein|nr:branched-chain amino acid ABC transporter permease [Peptococcaceae bacterium]